MNIFIVASRIPFPLEKGDKLRLFHHIKSLSQLHDITLCCLSSSSLTNQQKEALSPYVKALHVFPLSPSRRFFRMLKAWASPLPFQVTWFTDLRVKRRVQALVDEDQPDVIYCQLVRCAEYVKDLHHVPKVLDYMDALSAGMHRRAHTEQQGWKRWIRWLMRAEGTRLARYESRMFDYFDAHLVISRNDRLLIPHRDREDIHLVPNGVDLSAFFPADQRSLTPPVLLFSGNMSYAPNVDAAHYLVEEILPRVKNPDVRVVLAGAEPKASIQALASDKVTVTGWIDDIAEEYRKSTLFVAPLRMGTGLQNKVLEAMATELPCVLSPHAFSPLGLPTEGHTEVCQDAESFAQKIDALLDNPEQAQAMAQRAKQQVEVVFSWEQHGRRLHDILKETSQLK